MPYIGNVTTSSNVNGSQINNGTITGDKLSLPFDYDSATLYLDSVNNRVGIGTTSPDGNLTIGGLTNTGGQSVDAINVNRTDGLRLFGVKWDVTSNEVRFSGNTKNYVFRNGSSEAETARIDSSGRLGLGTSSPSSQFVVSNGGAAGLEINPTGVASAPVLVSYNRSGSAYTQLTYDGAQHVFNVSGTEKARIDTSGRLGIGASSPGGLLEVKSADQNPNIFRLYNAYNAGASSWGVDFYRDTDSGNNLSVAEIKAVRTGGNTSELKFGTSSTPGTVVERVRISSAGNVGIGTTSPSASLDVVSASTSVAEFNGPANATVSFTGSGFVEGKIQCGGEFVVGSTNNYPVAFVANGTERARIDTSGRLLVGTSTARTDYFNNTLTAMLQVEGINSSGAADRACVSIVNNNNLTVNESPVLVLGRSNGSTVNSKTIVSDGTRCGYISFQGADGSDLVDAASIAGEVDGTPGANDMPGRLVFSTTADGAASPTERMRISNDGTVYVGTTSKTGEGIALEDTSNGGRLYIGRNNNDSVAEFQYSGTRVGQINVTSTSTSYITSSDYRLKENVVPLTGAIDRLQQIPVHRFNFIVDPDKTVDGFIAHEAQAVVPECVTGEKDAVDDNGNPVYQGIDQSKLVPLLTAALQEAVAEIKALKDRVTALEGA